MGITCVLGTAGSGKTHFARHKAAELALSGKRAVLLVPEQFSFETERAMLSLLEPKYADRVEVFSFTRLADKIAHEVGGICGRRLDDCGRAAVMHRAMSQVQDHLTLYASVKKGQDIIANLLAAVEEFKSCLITPDMLYQAAADTSETVLAEKLRELSLIYGAYNADIANLHSIDPLDDLSRLAKQLETADFFEGCTVIADSFTGFTKQELAVLERVIAQSEDFIITLCCDDSPTDRRPQGDTSLFSSVQDTGRAMFAFSDDITYEGSETSHRFTSEALRRLEANVFRFEKVEPYTEPTDDVTIYAAADAYDEAEFTAREIRRLVREKGMRWRDFAIICRTASDYQVPMLRALALQGIPCFCDRRVPITDSPIVRFALSALDIVNGRWRSEDIFRWLKTGMVADVDMTAAARLENYCFVWSISGSKWKQPFTQSPYGYTDRTDDQEEEQLALINTSRKCLVSLLQAFETAVKSEQAGGRDMAAALYRLMEDAGAAACIERMLPKLPQEDAERLGQVWNALMGILDQLADILSDSRLSFREFSDLFTLMVGMCDVGKIPQGMDEVVFGAADRIRTSDTKVVFVIGANDGVFPLTPSSSGVFTESERKALIGMQLPLSGDAEDMAVSEQFLAYSAMTCASEKLYVTYSTSKKDEALYSSEIVSEIHRVLPGCRRLAYDGTLRPEMVESEEAGFLLAAAHLRDGTVTAASLAECYRRREPYADRLEVVRSTALRNHIALHNKTYAYALFGRNIHISASKAECFHNCRFQYFCQYGMKALPRRRAELDPLEYGNVVHYVLEKLLAAYDLGALVDDEHLGDKIRTLLEQYLNEVMGGSEMKSARFLYLFGRLTETLTVLVLQLGEEFAKSLFVPEAFEVPIDGSQMQPLQIPLSDGTHISVGGKIDRVDVFRSEGVSYVRVVDYKTGSKEFVLSDILAGLNMQMLIYLDIICDSRLSHRSLSPAGVVYAPASLRRIAGVRGETSLQEERQEMLKKNGLLVDDAEVLNAMELGMEKKVDKKANAHVKSADTFRSSSTYVAGAQQLSVILGYVRTMLRQMGEALHSGDIQPLPAKGTYDACAYCQYQVMCSQECRQQGREIRKLSMTETLDIMECAVSDDTSDHHPEGSDAT